METVGMIAKQDGIGAIIKRIGRLRELSTRKSGSVPAALWRAEETVQCRACHDTGWVKRETEGRTVMVPCQCSAKRQVERYLRQSGINASDYAQYTLARFQADTQEARNMKRLAECYIAQHRPGEGIGYFGQSGTGKTHICIAICQELTRRENVAHFYFPYRQEIQRLKLVMYSDQQQYNELMHRWTTCRYLYVDDLFKFAGRDGKIQQQDLQIMFDILNTRYLKKLETIFSSEYAVADITGKIDKALGSRIYSMVANYAMATQGENRRLPK